MLADRLTKSSLAVVNGFCWKLIHDPKHLSEKTRTKMQLGRFAKAIKEETEAEEQEKMSDATFLVGKTDADGWLPVKYPEDIALWMQSLQAKAVKDERTMEHDLDFDPTGLSLKMAKRTKGRYLWSARSGPPLPKA